MKATYEFRILEKYATLLFSDTDGRRSGLAIIITISENDPILSMIGELDKYIHEKICDYFFFGWNINRIHSKSELDAASLFKFTITPASTFEPSGEECGTIYDESISCAQCGLGTSQVGPLLLRIKSIPKHKDFCQTISNEIILSRRAMDTFLDNNITGLSFGDIYMILITLKHDQQGGFNLRLRLRMQI